MRIACLLVMTSFGLMQGTIYVYSSSLTPKQIPASSRRAGSDHSRDAGRTATASSSDDKRPKVGIPSDEHVNDRHISAKSHSRSRGSLIKANRPQQFRNIRERSTSVNMRSVLAPSSGNPAAGGAKIANSRTLPVRTTGLATLNGQQFKNSRNRGVGLATIGGPTRAPRNAAAINGTSTLRKHVN